MHHRDIEGGRVGFERVRAADGGAAAALALGVDGAPDDLADFLADLLDGVHGPDDVEVFVAFDDFLVHDADVRFAAAVEAAQEAAAVDEVVGAADPEGERRELFVVPGEFSSGRVVVLVGEGLAVEGGEVALEFAPFGDVWFAVDVESSYDFVVL